MFSLFIVLSGFSETLAIKCLLLNDGLCMIRLTLTNINPAEVKYYPFINSSNRCVGSCNVLSPKICVPKETKDINVKAFNMITNKDEAQQRFRVIVNANSIVQHKIQIRNGIIKHANVNVKVIISAKRIIVGILALLFVRLVSA